MEVSGRLDAPAAFPPGEVPIDFEAESAAGPFWTPWLSNHYSDNVCRSKYLFYLVFKSQFDFLCCVCLLGWLIDCSLDCSA